MAVANVPPVKAELPTSPESNGTSVAAFIAKVWKIVNKREYEHLISWSDSGKTFTVHDYSSFAKEVLPHYFKHSNFASFVRQLNLYGFRKVAKPEQGVLAGGVHDYDVVEFWHTNFRKNHPELLPLVQRRSVASRTSGEEKHPNISRVMNDLHQLNGRHESIASMLENLKRENVVLKQEMAQLKRKHSNQQKLINKVIHFLMNMLYKGRLPTRKGQLMLTDKETISSVMMLPKSKRPRLDTDTVGSPSQSYEVQSPPSVIEDLLTPSISSVRDSITETNPRQTSSLSADPLDMFAADDSDANEEELLSSLAFDQLSQPALRQQSSDLQSIPQYSLPISLSSPGVMSPLEPSLVPYQDPSNVDHVSSHLDQHQQVIDSLPDLLSGQLSIDPLVLSAFLYSDSQHQPFPDYDQVDTARLLESLTDPDSEVPHESTVKNAVVPFSQAPLLTDLFGYDDLSTT